MLKLGPPFFTVQATDDDKSELYGTISKYMIQDTSNLPLPFDLNSTSGQLVLTEPPGLRHWDPYDTPSLS